MDEDKWRIERHTYSHYKSDPQSFYSYWYVRPPVYSDEVRLYGGDMRGFDTWREAYDYAYRKVSVLRLAAEFEWWVESNWDRSISIFKFFGGGPAYMMENVAFRAEWGSAE